MRAGVQVEEYVYRRRRLVAVKEGYPEVLNVEHFGKPEGQPVAQRNRLSRVVKRLFV